MGGEQLKVTYADGSSRIVNLSPDFFTNSSVYSSLLKKMTVMGPADKAKQLAEIYGRRPLVIVLTQGGHVVFKKETEWTQKGEPRVEKVTRDKVKRVQRAVRNAEPLGTVRSFRMLESWNHGLSA